MPPGRPQTDSLTAVPQQLGKGWFGNRKDSFEAGSPGQPGVITAVPGAVPAVETCPGGAAPLPAPLLVPRERLLLPLKAAI